MKMEEANEEAMKNYKSCVLIVNDGMRMWTAFRDYLKRKNYQIIEAADGEQALETCFQCDVFVTNSPEGLPF